jgi:hypothetical protein
MGEHERTRTLESPPAVASLYCLPPAMIGPAVEVEAEAEEEELSSSAKSLFS